MRHPSVILALSYSFGEYSESSKEDPCMCITKLEVIQEIKSLDVPNDRSQVRQPYRVCFENEIK